MIDAPDDPRFDDVVALALAESAAAGNIAPPADAKARLMARLRALPTTPNCERRKAAIAPPDEPLGP